MSDILTTILARKADEIRERSQRVSLRELSARCEGLPPTRGFGAALQAKIAAGKPAVIAEIKKASPSKGVIRNDYWVIDSVGRRAPILLPMHDDGQATRKGLHREHWPDSSRNSGEQAPQSQPLSRSSRSDASKALLAQQEKGHVSAQSAGQFPRGPGPVDGGRIVGGRRETAAWRLGPG